MNLSYHGKTTQACMWVIENYGDREDYKDNASVQQWVKDSWDFLKENDA